MEKEICLLYDGFFKACIRIIYTNNRLILVVLNLNMNNCVFMKNTNCLLGKDMGGKNKPGLDIKFRFRQFRCERPIPNPTVPSYY